MTLINRISSLFKADMHGLLDCIEDPEMVLGQAIRDMEEALARREEELKALAEREQGYRERRESRQHTIAEIQEQIELCLNAGKDDLAKAAIKRRLEAERSLAALSAAAAQAGGGKESLEKRIKEDREKLAAVKAKAEAIREKRDFFGASASGAGDSAISEHEIEIAFLREKQKRAAHAEADQLTK